MPESLHENRCRRKILKANEQLAQEKRTRLTNSGTLGLNVVGSPGAGKTTLLEGIFPCLPDTLSPAVIEGDIAGFDLGEHVRIVVLSVPEGDDKIAKYPAIFRSSDALVITKTDLAPHVPFCVDRVLRGMKALAPTARVFRVCALTDTGTAELAAWLAGRWEELQASGASK